MGTAKGLYPVLFTLFPAGYVLIALNQPFFWDTIQLASKHAHFFYEHRFERFLLPEPIDSGHPPLFGAYIALLWTLFGKSLWVSHLGMLPFALGIGWLSYQIVRDLNIEQAGFGTLLLLCDPVLAAQLTLVSPDVVLIFFFLLAVFGIWKDRPVWLSLAVLGLAMVSMRGMMVAAGLFLYVLLRDYQQGKKGWPVLFKRLLLFLPSGLFALMFLGWHWQAAGWIGHHAQSEWAPSFERVDLRGFWWNAGLLGWRMLDFGRVFIWLGILLVLLSRGWAIGKPADPGLQKTMGLFWVLLLVSLPSFLLYTGLSGHRYLLPVFLSLSLVLVALLQKTPLQGRRWSLLRALIWGGLISGHLWVYPRSVAQGWDASLAYLPYNGLRKKVIAELDAAKVPLYKVGTWFPAIGPLEFKDLNGRQDGFKPADLEADSLIFYSNVFNDPSDEELDELKKWTIVKKLDSWTVETILYRKPLDP
jgi:hypothetical protein